MKKTLTLLFLVLTATLFAQQTKHLNLEDAVLGYYKGLHPEQKSIQWIEGSNDFLVIENNLAQVNYNISKRAALFSFEDLQEAIPALKRMPYSFSKITSEVVCFTNDNTMITYNYQTKKVVDEIKYPSEIANSDFNTQGNAIVYTIDNNLYVSSSGQSKIAITTSKDKNIVSGKAIARSEMGITKGTFWSPNGNILAFYQKDESNVTNYPLVDVTTTPATLNNIKYPMNGMGSEIAKVGVYNRDTNKLIYLDIDTSDEHYLTNLSWSPDNKYVFLAEVNRDQNHFYFNKYDVSSGKKVNTIFEEQNDKWVEPEHIAVFLPKSTTEFLWLSERDGFMNLYLYDTNKRFVKQLTNYKWVIKSILGFDEAEKHVIITGTGEDPRETKAFKVSLKNGKTELLTKEEGVHRIQLSPNGNYIMDSYSSLKVPRVIKRKDINTGEELTIFKAENPIEGFQLGTTSFVTLKAKDGKDLQARMIKPANFDASKKYPVLIYVYGGPHAQMVTNSWLAGSNLWMQWMAAEQDYIVFTLDNHGSANRGFAFESAIHRQVGEVEMEDQLIGVDYLKSLPFVDGKRLAVHGWSYGGFMANSLMLRHPGVFTTAVAGGPVTNWKWYEIMYGERYMDRWQDNEAGFEKSKVHNYVDNLDGKLLEIIGSVDPVVVPQHTMTLLQAFVKAKKQVDFLSYPMHPHNVRGLDRAHLMQKVLEYVIENNK